jgi:peptide/nickel transport system permease protein
MGGFVARRLLQAVPTFFGITLLSFIVLRLAPGDPVSLMVAGVQDLTPQDLANMRAA